MCLPGYNLARTKVPLLSLCTVALNVNSLWLVNLCPLVAHSITERRGIEDQSAIDRDAYLDFIVLALIVVCIVNTQRTG